MYLIFLGTLKISVCTIVYPLQNCIKYYRQKKKKKKKGQFILPCKRMGKWKTWKAGTGTGTEIRKRSSDAHIIIVTPSCLDSTICHSSCLNCALYIFDKAAQDQMIGVTGHD